jgi:hypothetical protein
MNPVYRRSAPKPPPPPVIDTDALEFYAMKLESRRERWKTVMQWAWIFGVGLLVTAVAVIFIGLMIQNQEAKARCERQGYTWIETEYSSKCIAVKEVK